MRIKLTKREQFSGGLLERGTVVLSAAVLLVFAAACGKNSGNSDAQVPLTPQQMNGRMIFDHACGGCHNDTSESKGPSLKGLYKKQYLPSGLPVNDTFVERTIVGGRGVMPGLGDSISDQQLADLVAYLHTL